MRPRPISHALIAAAKIPMPVILVGHSLGTNIVRRLRRSATRATSPASCSSIRRRSTRASSRPNGSRPTMRSTSSVIAFAKHCEEAAADGKLANASGDLARCIRAPDPRYPEALNAAIHAQKEKPPFWHTLISEMQTNMNLFEEPVSAERIAWLDPADRARRRRSVRRRAARRQAGDGIRAAEDARRPSSRRPRAASNGWCAHSSHDMQLDQPQAVATAVADAIKASRVSAK